MSDFKLLLETQKETNKQLALLRQEQMQIAKDPPEKFLEGEEFKATALHIASEKLSGMHETDDEVKKLREIFQGATEKSEKILKQIFKNFFNYEHFLGIFDKNGPRAENKPNF